MILAGLRSVAAPVVGRQGGKRKRSRDSRDTHGHVSCTRTPTHELPTIGAHFCPQNPGSRFDDLGGPRLSRAPVQRLHRNSKVRLSTSCVTSSRSPVKSCSLLDAEWRKSRRGDVGTSLCQIKSIFLKKTKNKKQVYHLFTLLLEYQSYT